jgi:hypothetical protein
MLVLPNTGRALVEGVAVPFVFTMALTRCRSTNEAEEGDGEECEGLRHV